MVPITTIAPVQLPHLESAFMEIMTSHWQIEKTEEFAVWRGNSLAARAYPESGRLRLTYFEFNPVPPSQANRFACGD